MKNISLVIILLIQNSPTDIINEIAGNSMTASVTLGPFSYLHGKTSDNKGIIQQRGAMSNTIGLGKSGLGISTQVSNTVVWRPFK